MFRRSRACLKSPSTQGPSLTRAASAEATGLARTQSTTSFAAFDSTSYVAEPSRVEKWDSHAPPDNCALTTESYQGLRSTEEDVALSPSTQSASCAARRRAPANQ